MSNQLKIPRCVKFNVHQPIVEVHGFCDASQRAFDACIYLRINSVSLQVAVLKISRRAAQNRFVTAIRAIGRFIIGVLNQQGRESLEFSQCPTMSDSTIALNWIISPSW